MVFGLLGCLASIVGTAGCSPGARPAAVTPAGRQARQLLERLPADTGMLFSVDLARLREQPVWAPLLARLDQLAQPRGSGGSIVFRHVQHAVLALPSERQPDDRFFVLATVDSAEVPPLRRAMERHGVTIIDQADGKLVFARGAWAGANLGPGRGSATAGANEELVRLVGRVHGSHAVWLAAIIPTSLRRQAMARPDFPDFGSIARLSGYLDVDGGLHAHVLAETSASADADSIARRVTRFLNQAKRHPDMLVEGLSPVVDAIRVVAEGPMLRATMDLAPGPLADFIPRIEALADARRTK